MLYRGCIFLLCYFLTACASNKTLIERVENLPASSAGSSGVELNYWSKIGGRSIRALTRNKRYPNDFNDQEFITKIDFFDSKGDKYAQRITGLVTVDASGPYEFWVSADDSAEVWLSTDQNPINKRLVALVNKPSGYKIWDKYRSQKSNPITLEQGNQYYLEVLHKDHNGGDYLNVSWKGPDFELETLSSTHLKAYSEGSIDSDVYQEGYHIGYQAGSHIAPYDSQYPIPDADLDGLPDFYESLVGLDPNDPTDAQNDLDADSLTAVDEYILLTNPNLSDSDSDGMPDGFEVMYGLSAINGQDALLDLDGDGFTNLEEYNQGTKPDDINDVPEIEKLQALTLNWLMPTQREDGTGLSSEEIKSYNIYMGVDQDTLTVHSVVEGSDSLSLTIENMSSGPHIFAISTVTKDGLEGAKSLLSVNL